MDELPDKIVSLDVLRINRGIGKKCKCKDRTFVIDTENREVCCGSCGVVVDPYEAIYEVAFEHERLNQETENLLQQRRQLSQYKPWLVVIRKLEERYRGRKMLPCCPHCSKAFYLEELTFWTNAEMEKRRRERERG